MKKCIPKRRILILILTISVLSSVLAAPAFAAEAEPFSDALSRSGGYTSSFGDMAARRLYVYGLIDNRDDSAEKISDKELHFETESTAGRLDAALLLYNLCGYDTVECCPFTDLPYEYIDAVDWLYATGITKGIGNNMYGTGALTEHQFLVMLSRLLDWKIEAPDELRERCEATGLLPIMSNRDDFSLGDMYQIACNLLDRFYPEHRIAVRQKMSTPDIIRIQADSYADAGRQIQLAMTYLPNLIKINFTEACPSEDLEAFRLHYDWVDGNQELPIIGLTNRLYLMPYYLGDYGDREFKMFISGYAQGHIACACDSDWLSVYQDANYQTALLQFRDEKIMPLRALSTEYQRAKEAHDLLCRLASYDYTEYNAQTGAATGFRFQAHDILGFIENGKIVCDGYANVYQWMLMNLGIESYIVVGKANRGNHAWNKVRIDGVWYNVDVCWDDAAYNSKLYFMKSDNWFISHNHSFTDSFSTTAFISASNY